MTRSVVALDPTVSAISLARITDDLSVLPGTWLTTSDDNADHSIAGTLARHHAAIDEVMGRLGDTKPELVVMAKNLTGEMKRDPSGARRSGLWWLLAERLTAEGIPVAEYPALSLSAWWKGAPQTATSLKTQGRVDYVVGGVQGMWDGMTDRGDRYRWTTVALAAAGAMAVGIPTRVDVTDARLRYLKSMVLPSEIRLPYDAAAWKAKYASPVAAA